MRRVLYHDGPGNAFAAYRAWSEGRNDDSINHIGHSAQLFDAASQNGYKLLVTSSCPDQKDQKGQGISVTYRPDPTWGVSGLAYHRALSAKARQVIKDAKEFGADLVIIDESSNPRHFAGLSRHGVKIVQILHSQLWAEGQRPGLMQRLRLRDFGRGYRGSIFAVLSASEAISDQVRQIAGPRCCPIIEFMPHYPAGFNADTPAPDLAVPQLDIAYLGPITAQNGPCDPIEIAGELAQRQVGLRLHICGQGPALVQMQQQISARGLEDYFVCHDHNPRQGIGKILARCQLSILPTGFGQPQGFDQIAVESLLAGRPVMISDRNPATRYLGDSAIAVPAQDYVEVLQRLSRDRDDLARYVSACQESSRRFVARQHSLGAAVTAVFKAMHQGGAAQALQV